MLKREKCKGLGQTCHLIKSNFYNKGYVGITWGWISYFFCLIWKQISLKYQNYKIMFYNSCFFILTLTTSHHYMSTTTDHDFNCHWQSFQSSLITFNHLPPLPTTIRTITLTIASICLLIAIVVITFHCCGRGDGWSNCVKHNSEYGNTCK